jgi:histidyl-tRNA synthetase
VLFLNFGQAEALYGLKAVKALRESGVKAELYPDDAKMKKQMNYANKRGMPFVVLAGESEMTQSIYTLKDMASGTQDQLNLDELIEKLRS